MCGAACSGKTTYLGALPLGNTIIHQEQCQNIVRRKFGVLTEAQEYDYWVIMCANLIKKQWEFCDDFWFEQRTLSNTEGAKFFNKLAEHGVATTQCDLVLEYLSVDIDIALSRMRCRPKQYRIPEAVLEATVKMAPPTEKFAELLHPRVENCYVNYINEDLLIKAE